MKTRYKILTIIVISITGFLVVPFYATNIYCDVFEPANGGCIRIAGFGIIDYTQLPYFVIDFQNTANPNECWYDDGDGNIIPCKIETGPILWPPPSPTDLDCDEECPDKETGHSFRGKPVTVEGDMAEKICAITGGECLPFYPGNLQDDGSIMVGFVISEKDKIKHYQFFIRNDTLSHTATEIENEN